MKVLELFKAGELRMRMPSWGKGTYIELTDIGGFVAPVCRLRDVFMEKDDVPATMRHDPKARTILVFQLGDGDEWLPYEGETAPALEE